MGTDPTKESEGARATLGDVLYPDKGKAVASEEDWATLVQRIADGDQAALREVYDRMHRIVFTQMIRVTHSRETAEELTVDVFHDVWRRAPAYDPAAGTAIAWIMNQARSRVIDRVRFEHRKKRVAPHGERPGDTPAGSRPEQDFESAEQGRLLRDALAGLTTDERRAIETAFFSGLTYAETAVRLDEPLGTIKTRVRSGLGKLRDALSATVGAR